MSTNNSPMLCKHGFSQEQRCRFDCHTFDCICYSCDGTGVRVRLGTPGEDCSCTQKMTSSKP